MNEENQVLDLFDKENAKSLIELFDVLMNIQVDWFGIILFEYINVHVLPMHELF